jgi:hypothetical protein
MKEIFNIILIITILVTVYYFIQNSTKNTTNTSTENIASLSTNINTNTNKSIIPEQKQIENFVDLDTKYINFDYDLRPIEKEFIKEQKNGAYLNTWYPNTWIDHIDENGNPVYDSREHVTGKADTFINEPKSSFSYDFNNVKTGNMSGVLKPEDFKGKTIKEVYDNSMVDYKKLGPQKTRLTDETTDTVMPGGSNLTYFTSDTWTYKDENPENGGLIYDNVYGDDPMSNTVSVF